MWRVLLMMPVIGGLAALFIFVSHLLVGAGLAWIMWPLFAFYIVSLMAAVQHLIIGREPAYWHVGQRHLTAFWMYRWQRLRYDEIVSVEEAEDECTLLTAQRRVTLGRNTLNWHSLARQIRERLGLPVEPEVDDDLEVTIPPETVAGWLQLEPGEVLHLQARPWRVIAGALGAIGIVALILPQWRFGSALLTGGVVGGVIGGAIGLLSMRSQNSRAGEVRASGESLQVRCEQGWRTVAWGTIRSLERRQAGWMQVCTTTGDVLLPPWMNKRRLLPAIEQAVEARRAGEVLPRLVGGDVSDAALSRAAGEEASERAVSRTAPGR
jgi:hypothetical protein